MAKSKVENFPDLVRQSGLVEPGELQRALGQLQQELGDSAALDPDCVAAKLVQSGLLTPWHCENLLQGRYKGFFLKGGQYRLLDHLGSGGMSHVYLGEHVLMQRRVAIKVLPRNRVKDSSYLARFRREAQAVAALDHRNIVRAYDVDQEGDTHYLVMEFVEGRDLQAMVREEGPLSYARAVEYVRQAAEGLEHAHRAGLIHRDVKPANLLVDHNGVVKLLDLGLARFTGEDQAALTVAYDENVLGTADYLAPEQAIDSHAVDGRADIYSLGCSLYFLLTGHPPYASGTLPQRLMMHQKAPPPDLREDRPDAPEDLVNIAKRMMAKKASNRYRTAGEVAEILGGWLAVHGHAVDPGLPPREAGAESASRLAQAPSAKPGGSSKASRGSGSRGPLKQATPLEPEQAVPAAASSTTGDTLSKLGHATVKGPGSSTDSNNANPQSKSGSAKATLKVAERLEEPGDALGDLFGNSTVPLARGIEPVGGMTSEELAEYRRRRKQNPALGLGSGGGGKPPGDRAGSAHRPALAMSDLKRPIPPKLNAGRSEGSRRGGSRSCCRNGSPPDRSPRT